VRVLPAARRADDFPVCRWLWPALTSNLLLVSTAEIGRIATRGGHGDRVTRSESAESESPLVSPTPATTGRDNLKGLKRGAGKQQLSAIDGAAAGAAGPPGLSMTQQALASVVYSIPGGGKAGEEGAEEVGHWCVGKSLMEPQLCFGEACELLVQGTRVGELDAASTQVDEWSELTLSITPAPTLLRHTVRQAHPEAPCLTPLPPPPTPAHQLAQHEPHSLPCPTCSRAVRPSA